MGAEENRDIVARIGRADAGSSSTGALAAHLAPHRVEQEAGHPWQLPVALAVRHQLAAQPAEHPPVEVDDVIAAVPGVKRTQTVGVPDDLLGEMVVSCIVPIDGAG